MKLAIMQPYLFPYIGYFQLIKSVDRFIVYDNLKYTKKGWINRNRMLQDGKSVVFSIPLKRDSDSLDIGHRELAADFNPGKLLNQFRAAYRRAPQFAQTYPIVEKVLRSKERNLFRFLHNSIEEICGHLRIRTPIAISSEIRIDHTLKGQDKVLALCRSEGAHTYVNAIGGTELYAKEAFLANGVELQFIQSRPFEYPQSGGRFVPWLSIVDVMMFNPTEEIDTWLSSHYDLI